MYKETNFRSILKAISWRINGTLATTLIVYIVTHKAAVAIFLGALEFVSKIALFFVHERIWNKVKFGKHQIQSAVIWLTGFSGSGKSTIAGNLYEEMKKMGFKVECLDGDSVRDIFPQTGFTKNDRDEHVRKIGYLASKLESNGIFVIASFISPYRESREFVRRLCKNFVEVHVATPIEECERRDVKGLYAKARRGEIKNFTGINDPYEPPDKPEIVINTQDLAVGVAAQKIISFLDKPSLNEKP